MTKIIFILLFALIFLSSPVLAQEATTGDYLEAVGTKAARGLLNVVTSPAEIPCTMSSEIETRGAGAGIFTGFGQGTVFMLRRILVGVTEVGTFMIPMERTIPPVCQSAE